MGTQEQELAGGLAGEGGFTLIELLVAITIALIVTTGAAMVLILAVKDQPRIAERSAQIQQGRTMVEGIGRELRQGVSIPVALASQLEILTFVPVTACGSGTTGTATLCRVSYACDADACLRTEREADGTGAAPAEQVVSGITGPDVFTYEGDDPLDPSYVAIGLIFPRDDGDEAVTVADGVALRNHPDAIGGG